MPTCMPFPTIYIKIRDTPIWIPRNKSSLRIETSLRVLGVPYEKQRIITCHIGNGGSITAIKDGKSVDTSMGMTPVEGLMMGTRSGDVDAGVLTYLMDKEHLDSAGVANLVNKKAEWLVYRDYLPT